MDSAPSAELEKPSVFDKCLLNWTIKPAGKDSSGCKYFVCSDEELNLRFVFQRAVKQQCYYAKNRYGDIIFKCMTTGNRYINVPIMTTNKKRLALITLNSIKFEADQNYYVSTEIGKFIVLHGPYQGLFKAEEEIEKKELKPFVKYFWDTNHLKIISVKENCQISDNILMAAILAKGLQLIMHYSQRGLLKYQLPDTPFEWLPLRSYPTDVLFALRNVGKSLLSFSRIQMGYNWHHYIEDSDKNVLLVMEYNEQTKMLEVCNQLGILQFYASMDFNGASSLVNLHPRIVIGKIQHENLVYKYEDIVMRAQNLNSQREMDYEITDTKGCKVCTIVSGENGITIEMSTEIPPDRKALILTYVFREAVKSIIFQSIPGSQQNLAPIDYSEYHRFRMLPLLTPKLLMRLENLGHNGEGDLSYYGVIDGESGTERHLAAVFTVDERPGSVQAACLDQNLLLTFSVSGLWNMESDLVISNGHVLGMNRRDTFFDECGRALFFVEKQTDPNWTEIFRIYKKFPMPGEHPQVVQIFGNKDSLFIQFMHPYLTDNQKALIVAYALKLGINMYKMYTCPVKAIDMPRNRTFTVPPPDITAQITQQTQEMKI